jgi:hypothetical protein
MVIEKKEFIEEFKEEFKEEKEEKKEEELIGTSFSSFSSRSRSTF